MTPVSPTESLRLLVVHKQTTSARTRFLRFAHGMLAFAPLPDQASVRAADAAEGDEAAKVILHPAMALGEAEQRLGLPGGSLALEHGFAIHIDTPQGEMRVLLAVCQGIDPPFAAAEALGGRFIALTEARGLPAVELQILRRAYEYIIG